MFQPVQAQMAIVPVDGSPVGRLPYPAAFLRRVVRLGGTERFLHDAEFWIGWFDGYSWENENGDFDEEEITLDAVVDLLRRNLSVPFLHEMNRFNAFLDIEPLAYARCVGFVLGWLRWMFDVDRGPYVPLALLKQWAAVERITATVATYMLADGEGQRVEQEREEERFSCSVSEPDGGAVPVQPVRLCLSLDDCQALWPD